jgi:hypothetical protein
MDHPGPRATYDKGVCLLHQGSIPKCPMGFGRLQAPTITNRQMIAFHP